MQTDNYSTLSKVKENILATLAYFDLFNYPLTADEIYLYLPGKCAQHEFDYLLRYLVIDRSVYKMGGFYSLKNDYGLIERREAGNARAAGLITIAKKLSGWLIRFPYVRGIAISGSLSKNFADEDSDIDLFIITAKNRLWIARTLMHFLKKLSYLVNKQHYLCMNYYIDEQALLIREQNIYTAIEIATLIPLQGDTFFEQFYAANAWTRDYLPNKCMRLATAKTVKDSLLKRLAEKLLNGPIGEWFDTRLLKITAERWRKKMQLKRRNIKGVIMCMDTGKHYAKPDPGNFQHKLLQRYKNKISLLLETDESSVAH